MTPRTPSRSLSTSYATPCCRISRSLRRSAEEKDESGRMKDEPDDQPLRGCLYLPGSSFILSPSLRLSFHLHPSSFPKVPLSVWESRAQEALFRGCRRRDLSHIRARSAVQVAGQADGVTDGKTPST